MSDEEMRFFKQMKIEAEYTNKFLFMILQELKEIKGLMKK